MRNDLISKSVLIDELKQSGMIADNDYGNAMVDFINNQPTAYDMDKVIRQFDSGHRDYYYDEAIEIVKEGAV